MADQFEIAHRTPGRTRLKWCGAGAPSQELVASFAASPAVQKIEYRPATGSLVLIHDRGYGLEEISGEVERAGSMISQKSSPPERPRRARRVPESRTIVLSDRPGSSSSGESAPTSPRSKWSPIVADVEAIVLLGLILGWIRDWLTGRNLAFGTVVLVILSGIALFQFWWRRQAKKEAAEPELEFIYA